MTRGTLCMSAAGIALAATLAQAQTVFVQQTGWSVARAQGITVSSTRFTWTGISPGACPVRPYPVIASPGVAPVARPWSAEALIAATGPNEVIDRRVVHTGSYNRVRLTGDVYTPSHLNARHRFERESRR